MKKLLFSIIVPVYNVEDYLEQCVNSIIAQEGTRDYEIILVDDGATDNSGTICDSFSDKYDFIKTFHKSNGGLSSARNYGTERATGEFILFIDSDDYVRSDALAECRDKLQRADDLGITVDVICTEGYFWDKNGIISEARLFNKHLLDDKNGGYRSSIEFLECVLNQACDWGAWGKFYRRTYWNEHKFKFLQGRNSEDMQLIYKVFIEAGYVCMMSAFVFYRYRIDSIAHCVSAKNMLDIIANLRDWEEYFSLNDLDGGVERKLKEYFAGTFLRSVVANVYNLKGSKRAEVIEQISDVKHWMKYVNGTEGRLAYLFSCLFGIKPTCRILAIIKRKRVMAELNSINGVRYSGKE